MQFAEIKDGFVHVRRLALTYRPVPTLGHFDAKAWLGRQFLVYTHLETSDNCSSSTSYCCRFVDSGDCKELDEADLILMQDAVFELGKVRQ